MSSPLVVCYTPPKPAPLPVDFNEFFASLSDAEKELHYLATQLLGSSYFVQWAPYYTKWKTAKLKASQEKQPVSQ